MAGGQLHELVSRETVDHIFLILLVLFPLIGLGVRLLKPDRSRQAFLIGVIGLINWLIWQLYNRVTNHYGLDTVKNLVVNLALFTFLGIGIGVTAGFTLRTPQK